MIMYFFKFIVLSLPVSCQFTSTIFLKIRLFNFKGETIFTSPVCSLEKKEILCQLVADVKIKLLSFEII